MMSPKPLILIPVSILLMIALPFLYIVSQILVARWRYRNIPSPKVKSFIMGHAQDFAEMETKGKHYSMLLIDWKKQLGSVFVLFIVNKPLVVCLEPSVVQELLVSSISLKPREFYETFIFLFGERFAGKGVFSQLNHSQWREQRKALNPAFKRGYLMGLMIQFNNSAEEMVTFLTAKADGKSEILMAKVFGKVSMDIIVKVAFGVNDLHVISDRDLPLALAAERCTYGVLLQNKLAFFDRIYLRGNVRREIEEIRKASKMIRDFGREVIRERFQAIQGGQEYPQDLLTQIVKLYAPGQEIEENKMTLMIDEFMTFFVGGQESSSNLMSFTLEFVGRRPDIYQKIQEEVDSIIGKRKFITYEDIANLEYLNLVLKETLRIAPSGVAVQRINPTCLTVAGVKIPARSTIELNTFALGRDERYWQEPEKFDPERFRSDTSGSRFAYFPFSLGTRNCIGQQFAMMECKIILAKLFQTFKFTIVPGSELRYFFDTDLKPLDKTPVYLSRRDND